MASDAVLSVTWRGDTLTAERAPNDLRVCAGAYAFIELACVPQEVARDYRQFFIDDIFTMRVTAGHGGVVWRKNDGDETKRIELVRIGVDCVGRLRVTKHYNAIRLGDHVIVRTNATPEYDSATERFGVVEKIGVFL